MELVALQTMLPKFDSPFESKAKALQLSQLMAADQQTKYQQQQQAQAQRDDASYRAALQANPGGGEGLLSALAGAGNYKGHAAAVKADLDAQKDRGDIDYKKAQTAETQGKTAKQAFELHRDRINLVNDPQSAAQWVKEAFEDPVTGPIVGRVGDLQTALSKIPTDPAGFARWKVQAALNSQEYVKHTSADANTLANNAQSNTNSIRTANSSRYSADKQAASSGARLAFDKSQVEGTGPDASEAMIDAIGQGRMAPPTGYALRNPKILAMMERVGQKYPEYDATEYAGKTKAMRDFASGTAGNSIRSFAVASDHLKQLDGLVDALENGNTPLINKYGNKLAQATGSEAPTNFDAAKGIVAKEVLKSIVAGGGGVEERQELAHLLDNAKTGKQLKGVIKTYLHLMEAQKDGLERQYELSTGRKDAKTRFNYGGEQAAPAAPPSGGVVDFGSLK